MSRPVILAVSHGTRSPLGSRSVKHLVRAVADELPAFDVQQAFVDVQKPRAADVISQDAPTVVVPLLLSRGHHVRRDLGRLTQGRTGRVLAPPLGPDPLLSEVLALRMEEMKDLRNAQKRPVVFVAAGSHDPDSLEDVIAMADLLAAATRTRVTPAFLAAQEPSLEEALSRYPDAIVVPYLLAHGFFFDRLQERARGRSITAPLLDDHAPPRPLVDLVITRARHGAAMLPS